MGKEKEFKTIEISGELILKDDTVQFRTLANIEPTLLPAEVFPVPAGLLSQGPRRAVLMAVVYPDGIGIKEKDWIISLAIHTVERVFSTTKADICQHSRKREVVVPRQTCTYLLWKYLHKPLLSDGMSWEEMGNVFGKNHSFACHDVAAVKSWLLQKKGYWPDKIRECLVVMDEAVTKYRSHYAA